MSLNPTDPPIYYTKEQQAELPTAQSYVQYIPYKFFYNELVLTLIGLITSISCLAFMRIHTDSKHLLGTIIVILILGFSIVLAVLGSRIQKSYIKLTVIGTTKKSDLPMVTANERRVLKMCVTFTFALAIGQLLVAGYALGEYFFLLLEGLLF